MRENAFHTFFTTHINILVDQSETLGFNVSQGSFQNRILFIYYLLNVHQEKIQFFENFNLKIR